MEGMLLGMFVVMDKEESFEQAVGNLYSFGYNHYII